MRKILVAMLMIAGASGVVMAGSTEVVPEINPTTAVGALTLLGGSVLVLRARLKR